MGSELRVVPASWPVRFTNCPPGHFVFNERLCFKSEYGDAYCDSGEHFWGGTLDAKARNELKVTPVSVEWVDAE